MSPSLASRGPAQAHHPAGGFRSSAAFVTADPSSQPDRDAAETISQHFLGYTVDVVKVSTRSPLTTGKIRRMRISLD